ncbi:MAG: neutral/alkaline non-lysosomal ceramidase N-terminal domain-containing protein [Acidobacteria bacterium]|nr:neutral/alkaline non-lysosomal ceramidase N-terminal domain-containing protein [Acidobacteriota bacterium]MBA3884214.1 neutral/alkaline non-lysosomal ceramidase N-terminal domain-containing protein [Acidobacteriota bacterium]
MLTAGFGKASITPPAGTPLAGYAARVDPSRGVHDDLYARALVLDDGRRPLVLVSVDVLALSADLVRRLRDGIRRRTGVTADGVMIAATHTHAGPVTMRTFCHPDERMDPAYAERFAAAVEQAAATAWESRAPSRVGIGSGTVSGVGVNRRSPGGVPVDEEIGLIKIEDIAGRTRGALVNFACHPTVLGPDNLLVSADFPFYAIARIEERLGAGSFALFVNGAEGDVSMGHSSELSAIGVITPGRTFERAEELGHRLADAALEALPGIACLDAQVLAGIRTTLALPLKTYPPLKEAARAAAEAAAEADRLAAAGAPWAEVGAARTRRLYASIMRYFATETRDLNGHLPIEVQAVRIGDALFVGAPAELFVEIGLRLKREARQRLFVIGLANGYIAYFPTRAAHATGGYEVISSLVTEEAEDRLAQHVRAVEAQVFA